MIKAADATLKVDERAKGNFIIVAAGEDAKPNANKPTKLVLTAVDAAKLSPFRDKIVRVQAVAGNRTEIFTLEKVRLTSLLGSEFIVGTAVKYGTDRYSGLEVYLNLRDVLTIVAMTPEQAKKFNESGPQPRSGQGPWNQPQGFNPQQGYNPPQRGQGPYNPPQGWNPPQGGQWRNSPPQPPGYNQPQGSNPSQGGQGPFNPPQPPGYNSPQAGPPPGYNPPQGGQPAPNQPQEPSDPDSH
jgi:hypothetical protein